MISQNESAKMIPEQECDPDIIQAVPDYDSYTVFPNKYGAWIQGAQWERNRQKEKEKPCVFQVVKDRYKKLVDEICDAKNDSDCSKFSIR
jgi:hypothetical protein